LEEKKLQAIAGDLIYSLINLADQTTNQQLKSKK
jgi:hypothetical protein